MTAASQCARPRVFGTPLGRFATYRGHSLSLLVLTIPTADCRNCSRRGRCRSCAGRGGPVSFRGHISPLVASHIGTGTHASAMHTSTHNPRPCIPSLRVPALSPPSRIISPCLRPPFSKRPDLTFSCRKATSEDLDLDISLSTNSFFSPSSAQVSPSSSWTNDGPENTGQRSNDKRYTYMYTPSAVRHPGNGGSARRCYGDDSAASSHVWCASGRRHGHGGAAHP